MVRLGLVALLATSVLTLAFRHTPDAASPVADSQIVEPGIDEAFGPALTEPAAIETAVESALPAPDASDPPDRPDGDAWLAGDVSPVALGRSAYIAARRGRSRRASPRSSPVWPVRGIITSVFGEVGPYSPRGHAGIDISAPWGTPVRSAAAGRVSAAGWYSGYGYRIVIAHPGSRSTLYAHLAEVQVEEGQPVARGQQVGLLGSTGYSTGPHLHFEVHLRGVLQDPLGYLP